MVPASSLGSRLQPAPVLVCQELVQVLGVDLGRSSGLWLLLQVQWMGVQQELGFWRWVLHPACSTGASSTLSCLKLSDGPLLLT